MAREWLLRGVDPEELKPDEKIGAPETPKGWWENFWYHHKWAFLGGLFAVVVAAVLITQMITRDLPDYRLVLMTEQTYLPPQIEQLEGLLNGYGQDLDGDGKVEVSIQNCCIGKNVDQRYNSGFQQVQAHLMAGDVLFFMWDADAYKTFSTTITNVMESGEQFLTPLPAAPQGLIEEGYVWSWEGDARRLTTFPERLYFGVRDTRGTAEEETDLHRHCMDLLEAFMLDQKTAE